MHTYVIRFPISSLKGTNRKIKVRAANIQQAREAAISYAHKNGRMFGNVVIREAA